MCVASLWATTDCRRPLVKYSQKTLALWALLVILAVFLFQAIENRHEKSIADFNYSKFSQAVKRGEIASVTIRPDTGEIRGEVKPEFEKQYEGRQFNIVGNVGDEGFKF